MKPKLTWYRVPTSEGTGEAQTDCADLEFRGSVWIMNSTSFKYICALDEEDRKMVSEVRDAEETTAELVTEDCQLIVPANDLVLNEISGNGPENAERGLGNLISGLLGMMGLRRKCPGCERRRDWLNSLSAAWRRV